MEVDGPERKTTFLYEWRILMDFGMLFARFSLHKVGV